MIAESEVADRIKGHGLIKGLDRVPRGHLRMETAFLYPDGSSIDLFLVNDLLNPAALKLTDLGQTTSWLSDLQVRPWLSKKRQRFLEDALRIYDVSQQGGALERKLSTLGGLTDGIVKLGQACVRVADLSYTRRNSLQTPVTEEVEEFLADSELSFEVNKELIGRRGAKVRVDFFVHGAAANTSVLTLSSGNASTAHAMANEVFRRWYDLQIPERSENKVTVFDDRFDVYREDDLDRLRDYSHVVPFSDRQTMKDLLAA